MPRDFDDPQGQRWTARQVGLYLDTVESPPESPPRRSLASDVERSIPLLADIEFRAATGPTVHGVLPDGELYRVSEDALREVLERALGAHESSRART
jgi:hypothetical protein